MIPIAVLGYDLDHVQVHFDDVDFTVSYVLAFSNGMHQLNIFCDEKGFKELAGYEYFYMYSYESVLSSKDSDWDKSRFSQTQIAFLKSIASALKNKIEG